MRCDEGLDFLLGKMCAISLVERVAEWCSLSTIRRGTESAAYLTSYKCRSNSLKLGCGSPIRSSIV